MKTLEFGLGASLSKILETLKGLEDEEVTLILPKESPLLHNPLNIKILEKEALKLNKKIEFAEGLILPPQTREQPPTQDLPKDDFKPLQTTFSKKHFWQTGGFKALMLGSAFLTFFVGGGYLFVHYVPTAKVVLYLHSQPLEKEITISGSPLISNVDFEKQAIPLTQLTTLKTGTSSAKVTGKKTVGKKASGKVTVRNYNIVTEKSFPKGTVLKGRDQVEGLKYSLEQAITIPKGSSSSRIDPSGKKINETDPGKVEADVVATEIGQNYNAPAHHQFSVAGEGFENVNAVTFSGTTGGESSEVPAVSESDAKGLTEKLSKELEIKAREEFLSKLSESQKLIEGSFEVKPSKKNFTKQVGEEAFEFGLSMEATLTGLAYNQEDLKELLLASVGKEVSDGYQLSDNSEITAEVVRTQGKEVVILGRIKGSMLTKVNKEELVGNLSNRSISSAQNYLRSQSNIAGFEIILTPTLPGPLNRMPSSQSKIRVEMTKKTS